VRAARRSGCAEIIQYVAANGQGLTLVHFSAQLEPCLTHKISLNTPYTPYDPLDTGYTTPTRTLYPMKGAQVELSSERV